MKTVSVPAQITTVEDKIAGHLTLQQLTLLLSSLFIDFSIFAGLPEPLKINLIKSICIILITLTFCISAIRVKGKLVLYWVILIARYEMRPKIYVFDKNDLYMRESQTKETKEDEVSIKPTTKNKLQRRAAVSSSDQLRLRRLINSELLELRFYKNKGVLNVSIAEKIK